MLKVFKPDGPHIHGCDSIAPVVCMLRLEVRRRRYAASMRGGFGLGDAGGGVGGLVGHG